jgi:predicted O-methyltransferase YrrM
LKLEALYHAIENKKSYFGKSILGIQGNPERQRHMTDLVKNICSHRNAKPLKILEIGSWAGASAVTWASAIQKYNKGLGQVFCVDPWESVKTSPANQEGWDLHMDNLLKNDFIYQMFIHNIQYSGCSSIVTALRGYSKDIIPNFAHNSFDIIYIDAGHDYESVKNDIKNSKPNLIINGILCGDDFELEFSKVDNEELLIHLNSGKDYCLDSKTGLYYHPGVTMALSEEILTVGSKDGFWFVQKDKNDNWKKFEFHTSTQMPSHIAKFL